MLNIVKAENQFHKNELLISLLNDNFSKIILIVADGESKKNWQVKLKDKNNILIFKIQDWWKFLFSKYFSNFKIISSDALELVIKSFCEKSILEEYGLKHIKSNQLKKYFEELFPLFSNPDQEEVINDWFENQEVGKSAKWRNIFKLSQFIWQTLLLKKHIPESAVVHYLQYSTDLGHLLKNTKLVIDLGAHLRSAESEIFLQMSQLSEIYIIEPSLIKQNEEYFWLNKPYELLKTRSYLEKSIKDYESQNEKPHLTNYIFKRFNSPVVETFFCINKIKELIVNQVDPNSIAILSPKIENYRSVIETEFKINQIPFKNKKFNNLIELSLFKKILALLKCRFCFQVFFIDVEQALFLVSQKTNINYLKFKEKYFNISNSTELFRIQEVANEINLYFEGLGERELQIASSDYINIDEFLKIIKLLLDQLSENSQSWFSNIEQNFKKFNMDDLHWRPPQWIEAFELFLKKIEVDSQAEPEVGVSVLSLHQLYSENFKFLFILGLNESDVKSDVSVLPGRDVLSLLHHTGHVLNHSDKNQNHFYLNWALRSNITIYYLFSDLDWTNKELTPSLFWTKGYYNQLKTSQLEEYSQLKFDSISKLNSSYSGGELAAEIRDNYKENLNLRLSPSGISLYLDCPFKFYNEKVINQKNENILDLDLSHLVSGNIYHKVCELLVKEPFQETILTFNNNPKQLIDEVLLDFKNDFVNSSQLQIFKDQIENWVSHFIKHEIKLRTSFQSLKTLYRELEFSTQIEGVRYSGVIDRIDVSETSKQFYVIDYKSSLSSISGYKSWIKNFDLQILSYIHAIQRGWSRDFKHSNCQSIGGAFFSLKNFDRKGFVLEDVSPDFYYEENSKSIISKDEFKDLIQSYDELLMEVVYKIKNREFAPKPNDKKNCKECSWRFTCPAQQQQNL